MLENDLTGELYLSRKVRGALRSLLDGPPVRAGGIVAVAVLARSADLSPVGVVQQIEHVHPELQVDPLIVGEPLRQAGVELMLRRQAHA